MICCQDVDEKKMSMFMDEALSSEDRSGIEAHLASCDRCRSELDGMLEVASVLRDRTAVDLALPQVVRSRIAREAAIRTQGGRWPFALPEWLYSVRPGALATGAAIVVALLVLPAVIHQRDAQQGRSEPVSTIRVTADGQAVHLAWSDGSRSSYTVYKSHDPRVFGRAEAHVIRGNSWVDRDADGAPIVFYRIE